MSDGPEIFDDLYLGLQAGGARRKQRRGEELTEEEAAAIGHWRRLSIWRKASRWAPLRSAPSVSGSRWAASSSAAGARRNARQRQGFAEKSWWPRPGQQRCVQLARVRSKVRSSACIDASTATR